MNAASLRLLTIVAVLASACDNSTGPILEPDAGQDAGQPDSGVDRVPPRVIGSTPADGADGVAPSDPIVIRFSEPMADLGTLALTADGVEITPVRGWSADETELTLSADLPGGALVRVVLERDFTDLAGNPLEAPHALTFTTGDGVPPTVTSADPAEGATVSARIATIRIAFSEPMDVAAGSLALEGGPGALGEVTWTLGGLVVPVSGLAYDTAYRVVLSGFADPSGNALDESEVLTDGALDFTTGPDTDAPRVTDASPSEGQIEVRETETTVSVLFDEPMDTSVTEATLSAGGSTVTVTGAWSEDGTRIDFDVAGQLAPNARHSLSLAGFRDAVGNALDPAPHLADGALDFVTGLDIFAPFVGFTDPVEGGSGFSFRSPSIVVVFSEAMDTSITTAEIVDGSSSFTATGTWSLAGTRLTLDVGGKLYASRSYTIDFSAFADAGGTALDTEHPYLGDGVLAFTMAAPTGENCQDALTLAQATTTGAVHEWVLAPGAATTLDGSNTCGRSNHDPAPDAVIRYTKTTPAASAGGTALRVVVESAETVGSGWMAVAALHDECDPAVAGTGAARLRCVSVDNPQHLYLDVGPGDYYVWFSDFDGGEFPGATVRIEEIAAPPEGETCVAPYTTATAAPIYAAPATADDPHVWTIPENAVQAMDHAVAYNGPGAMACDVDFDDDPDPNIGNDAVVALPKASDTSVGWLRFETTHASYNVVAQLLDRCDGTDPAAASLMCEADLRGSASSPDVVEATITGPAGDRYLWLATDDPYNDFPGGVVSYKEIEPGPGDTCATAIPITVGTTNAVTPDRPHRLPAPSCFEQTENVTWYRFTTTEPFTHVRADGDANIAAIRADGGELGCQESAAGDTPLVTFLPTGTDVCVAVASGAPITSLSVDAFPYAGNLGVPTPLDISRPLDGTRERSITNDYWMSVTPTTLYMGVGSTGVLIAPKSGGVVADWRDDFTPLTRSNVLGNDGVAVGESIFVLDDQDDLTDPRVYRMVRDGSFEPTVWDTGSAYLEIGIDAITYDGTSLLFVSDRTSSIPTHFYSLSPSAPGPATLLGTTDAVRNVSGVAADATYFYLVGQDASSDDGVFRIPRSDVTAPPVRLATVNVDITRASIEVDDLTAATYLYFRDDDGFVHVIGDPAGPTPQHLGAIAKLDGSSDIAMAIDHATGALYVFETATNDDGNFVRLD